MEPLEDKKQRIEHINSKQEEKGITPVISVIILIGIAFSAATSIYIVFDNFDNGSEENIIDDQFSFQIEQCYLEGSQTKINIRNAEKDSEVHTGSISAFIEGERTEPQIDNDTVPPQQIFTISFDKTLVDRQIQISTGDSTVNVDCNLDLDKVEPDFSYTPPYPVTNEEIEFDASETRGDVQIYEWDLNNNGDFENTGEKVSHSYSSSGTKEVELRTEDYLNNYNSKTLEIEVIDPEKYIFEGGDSIGSIIWGSEGSNTIVVEQSDTFCIGSRCEENTNNNPVESTYGDYANRDIAKINGTLTVQDKITWESGEELCIGSRCSTNKGDSSLSDIFYNTEEPLNGPLMANINSETQGIVTEGEICVGSDC